MGVQDPLFEDPFPSTSSPRSATPIEQALDSFEIRV